MNQQTQPPIILLGWNNSSRHPSFGEMNHDDMYPGGRPGIDSYIVGDKGQEYYNALGRVVENRSIGPSPVRRS